MADGEAKRGRGCVFYGCLTTALVFIGVILGIYFGTRQAVKYAVTTYTASGPAKVPALPISPAEQDRIFRSLEQRAAEIARSGSTNPVALGETELNVLISHSPDLRRFKDQIYLKPSGTQIQAHVSVPLDQFSLWKEFLQKLRARSLEGRYFNGIAVLSPSATNGALSLSISDVIVGGKSLPADFTSRLKTFDLAAQARKNPQTETLLKHVQNVEVRNDQLLITPAPPVAR